MANSHPRPYFTWASTLFANPRTLLGSAASIGCVCFLWNDRGGWMFKEHPRECQDPGFSTAAMIGVFHLTCEWFQWKPSLIFYKSIQGHDNKSPRACKNNVKIYFYWHLPLRWTAVITIKDKAFFFIADFFFFVIALLHRHLTLL